MKDFGTFLNENINNEEQLNENFMDVITSVGGTIAAIATTGFVGTLGYTIGSGVLTALEGSKLGDRGKEFAQKVKSLFNKGAELKKQGGDESEYADEFVSEIDNYRDVITELESGKLGEDGKKVAQQINKAKTAADSVN